MSEQKFLLDCGRLEDYLDKELVISINRMVTETEEERQRLKENDELSSEEFSDFISLFREGRDIEFSRNEDYHQVINEGILGNLFENILFMECRQNSGLIHLTAFIVKTLAESQVFADGNKRTAYISGCVFLMSFQQEKGVEAPVIPLLDGDFVSILQDIAVGEESLEFLEDYLRSLETSIERKI
ncbi:hypothetical protein [Candidatus Nanohalobium constans]|uniref:Death-on-curing family protein n=1 Tax=Candidatus Nanohalobium constans TaxID=2565781 RepID=A0A5Q0UFL0_9ARCH|nr:hypothetical protein [Candidatus Nanohalobium constans]QGA80378.1 death-on-curing family protein [Candidatus Nanohalobium constans]